MTTQSHQKEVLLKKLHSARTCTLLQREILDTVFVEVAMTYCFLLIIFEYAQSIIRDKQYLSRKKSYKQILQEVKYGNV